MILIRTILSLSLAAFALAVPVAQLQGDPLSPFCLSQYELLQP
jgi:hypothetical protein